MGSLELVMEHASDRAWERHLRIAMDSLVKVSARAAGHQASPGAAGNNPYRLPLTWLPQPGAHLCLMVRDNGGGIRAEEMERIFAPFFSHKFLGRGMGLPLEVA